MEEPEVPAGQLVESGEETTEVLDLADEAFNQVALPYSYLEPNLDWT